MRNLLNYFVYFLLFVSFFACSKSSSGPSAADQRGEFLNATWSAAGSQTVIVDGVNLTTRFPNLTVTFGYTSGLNGGSFSASGDNGVFQGVTEWRFAGEDVNSMMLSGSDYVTSTVSLSVTDNQTIIEFSTANVPDIVEVPTTSRIKGINGRYRMTLNK